MKRLPKIAFLSGLLLLGLCFYAVSANAQAKKTAKKPVKKAAPKESASKPVAKKETTSPGFKKLPSGLEYRIVQHGSGKRKPVINDHIEMHILVHIDDSIMFDSRKMYNNKPVPFPITAPKFKGDPIEGFMMMVVGDSAIFRLPVDSMKKAGNQLLPWMKEGMKVEYNVVLVSVKSEAEDKKDMEEKTAKQASVDDRILQEYFAKNNIKANKTASGLYYTISAPGQGENVKAGQKVSVNYTGKFLDGKPFDSNTDSNFHHMQPFDLEVGKGRVIKGWDEGLQLLKKGSKATFYIPSSLAYGAQERNPIPANSILVFDVEILDVQNPMDPNAQSAADDKLLQEYFAKNNVKPVKTPSGLYYLITQKGLGSYAKAGNKVTMNYTGKTMDGKAFDSNMDPKFNHVSPFTFTLGQGQVIKGWDEGVQLLQMGSKATFYIPSGLAYGDRGAGASIPPNAVLIFDVEVVGIDK
jgi:FKBP-type peptidyl-prolyl cis-trans isomerase FkpA